MDARTTAGEGTDNMGSEQHTLQGAERDLYQARAAFEGAPTQNNWSVLLTALQKFSTALQHHLDGAESHGGSSDQMTGSHQQLRASLKEVVETAGAATVEAAHLASLDTALDELFRELRRHQDMGDQEEKQAWWQRAGGD